MKILYPPEVGIKDPDIIEVRIGTGKKTNKHILAVKHRMLGWLDPWTWGLVAKIQLYFESVEPVKLVAWVTLTLAYKAGIDIVGDTVAWTNSYFDQLQKAVPGSGQIIQYEKALIQAVPLLGFIIGLIGPQVEKATGANLGDMMHGAASIEGEAAKWATAAGASALTIILSGSIAGVASKVLA